MGTVFHGHVFKEHVRDDVRNEVTSERERCAKKRSILAALGVYGAVLGDSQVVLERACGNSGDARVTKGFLVAVRVDANGFQCRVSREASNDHSVFEVSDLDDFDGSYPLSHFIVWHSYV